MTTSKPTTYGAQPSDLPVPPDRPVKWRVSQRVATSGVADIVYSAVVEAQSWMAARELGAQALKCDRDQVVAVLEAEVSP